ncbi:MAG: hypothetical protein WEB90_06630 [Gemmatimonadota bacterium]
MSTVAASHLTHAIGATETRRFHVRMATACAAVAFVGFAPTYWVPMVRGTLAVEPIAHLHAIFFYAWVLLFWWQASLAASGRMTRHREFGVAGVALASGMLFVGMAMSMHSIREAELAGAGASARAFSIVSVSGIVLFVGLIAVAVLNVRRPEVHKRLMLVATVSILQAGVGRWFLTFLAPPPAAGAAGSPPVAVTVMPGLVTNLLIVVAMVHDRRTRGRVHPAYWVAGGVVLAVQLLRVPLSGTVGWLRVTDWMLALAP